MSHSPDGAGVRHSILDLAPLELECMNALWPLGEATVRDIRQALVATRPRAYTTIMTILDRLAQKGIVLRRKSGRAWIYTPELSAEEARARAVTKIVDGFFDGSAEALAVHLSVLGDSAPLPGASAAAKERASLAAAPRPRREPQPESRELEPAVQPVRVLDATLL